MALILADCRENNGANPYLSANIAENNAHNSALSHKAGGGTIQFRVEQIGIGDYNILILDESAKTVLASIIERKTWKDLSASIKDGRMDRQCKEMQKMRDKSGCHIMYLIEGAVRYEDDYLVNGIPFKNLHAKVRHNVLRGIPYIHSKNEIQTAKIVVDLTRDVLKLHRSGELTFSSSEKSIIPEVLNTLNTLGVSDLTSDVSDLALGVSNSLNTSGISGVLDVSDVLGISAVDISGGFEIPSELKGRRPVVDEDIILRIWSSIPGITARSAVIIMNKYHISDVICALKTDKGRIEKELAELQFSTGNKFGKVKAAKIAELMYAGESKLTLDRQRKMFIKILAEIPNISAETAEIILGQHTMKDICGGYVDKDTLADIKKSNGRRIGKASEKICSILRKPVPIVPVTES
jgi:ERCC4-type nuclease